MNLELVPTARHSTAPSSFHCAVTSQGEASARTLGIRHRTTLPKTGIDGYGVPVRNGIFANAMIPRVRHCHHDAACFLRNAVNAVAVIMRVQGLIPRVTLRSPWALLCRAVGTGFRFISAFTDRLVLCAPSDFFKSVFQFSSIFCSVLAQTAEGPFIFSFFGVICHRPRKESKVLIYNKL